MEGGLQEEPVEYGGRIPAKHYMTVTKFQYILIIFIPWEFATN